MPFGLLNLNRFIVDPFISNAKFSPLNFPDTMTCPQQLYSGYTENLQTYPG